MRFIPASDASLLVETPHPIPLFRALRAARAPFVIDLHPAYDSVLVEFDLARVDHARVERLVRRLDVSAADVATTVAPGRLVQLPVVYDGPDLDDVARHCRLTRDDVIEQHAGATYAVAFLGFLPGFAYLSGLPARLSTPRLETPRARVPAGSVAIGGAQTAVYPVDSPGGWRLIGHVDVPLRPGWAEPGDRVRFVRVTR